jgi:excisionase family DNA binding protein
MPRKKPMPKFTLEDLRQKPFLDVNEVGQLFGCSPWTIRNWEYEGRLKAIRLAGLVRFERSAIEEFIQAARAR